MAQARIEISPAGKIDDAEALSRIYTPGVADDCRAGAAGIFRGLLDGGATDLTVPDENLVPAIARAVMNAPAE